MVSRLDWNQRWCLPPVGQGDVTLRSECAEVTGVYVSGFNSREVSGRIEDKTLSLVLGKIKTLVNYFYYGIKDGWKGKDQ